MLIPWIMAKQNIIQPNIENFGWISSVQKNRRGTFRLTLNRMIALGCGLEKGQKLYCYLAKDEEQRSIIVVYLDGDPKISHKKCRVCRKGEVEGRGLCRSCLNGFRAKYSETDMDDALDRFNGQEKEPR